MSGEWVGGLGVNNRRGEEQSHAGKLVLVRAGYSLLPGFPDRTKPTTFARANLRRWSEVNVPEHGAIFDRVLSRDCRRQETGRGNKRLLGGWGGEGCLAGVAGVDRVSGMNGWGDAMVIAAGCWGDVRRRSEFRCERVAEAKRRRRRCLTAFARSQVTLLGALGCCDHSIAAWPHVGDGCR